MWALRSRKNEQCSKLGTAALSNDRMLFTHIAHDCWDDGHLSKVAERNAVELRPMPEFQINNEPPIRLTDSP